LKATLVVFFFLKLAATVAVSPSIYPDGNTYRVPGAWLDFSRTSFGGHSIRPWGATIWMTLWPGDRALAIAQALLSFVAWSVLAIAAARRVRSPLVRRLLVVVLLAIPCTAQIANWDAVIQGDAVSMSTGVLALGLLLNFVLTPSWGRAAGFVAVALWFTMTRPNVFVIVLAWALGMIVIGAVRRQALLWGGVAVALLVIAGYSYVYNVHTDQAWTDRYGASRTTVAYAYVVGTSDPVAPSVIAALRRSDAPACMIPAVPDEVSHHGTTRWARSQARSCPGMNDWATHHWTAWWASWLVHHPGATGRILVRILPDSLSPSVWGAVYAPVPDSAAHLLLGSPALPQGPFPAKSYRTEPILIWLGAALALLAAGRVRRRWSPGGWAPDGILGLTVLGGLVAAASSALLVQTGGYEVAQESLAASVLISAAAVIAVAWGVDRVRSIPVETPPVAEPDGAEDPH
jgi:hypothetical protein